MRSVLPSSNSTAQSADPSASHSFSFAPESQSRAVPLSAALLKQNPALDAAVRSFESSRQRFDSAFVVPRHQPVASSSRAFFVEDHFGDDEMDDEDDEDDAWSNDEDEEAGDEWETRDGLLVLPSLLLPHPRASADLDDVSDDDSIYAVDDRLPMPSLTRAFSSSSSSSSEDEQTLAEAEDLHRSWERAMSFAGWKKGAEKDAWEHRQASPVLQRLVALASAA